MVRMSREDDQRVGEHTTGGEGRKWSRSVETGKGGDLVVEGRWKREVRRTCRWKGRERGGHWRLTEE